MKGIEAGPCPIYEYGYHRYPNGAEMCKCGAIWNGPEPSLLPPIVTASIDYVAAAKEMGMIIRGVLRHGAPSNKHDGVDSTLEGHWAGRVIGAALRTR